MLSSCESQKSFPGVSAHLFEYDHRFGKYGSDFTFYDYNQPLDLPQQHAQGFDTVVADPPYLVSYSLFEHCVNLLVCSEQRSSVCVASCDEVMTRNWLYSWCLA